MDTHKHNRQFIIILIVGSSSLAPQLDVIFTRTTSRNIRTEWMESSRFNKASVSFQRADACRSTAIWIQKPQLGDLVIATSQKKLSR